MAGINQFREMMGVDNQTAVFYMECSNNNLDQAIELYFQNNQSSANNASSGGGSGGIAGSNLNHQASHSHSATSTTTPNPTPKQIYLCHTGKSQFSYGTDGRSACTTISLTCAATLLQLAHAHYSHSHSAVPSTADSDAQEAQDAQQQVEFDLDQLFQQQPTLVASILEQGVASYRNSRSSSSVEHASCEEVLQANLFPSLEQQGMIIQGVLSGPLLIHMRTESCLLLFWTILTL